MSQSSSRVEAEQLFRQLSLFAAMANSNRAQMDGTMGPVQKIIEQGDVVLAVWQDYTRPFGIGALTVKGAAILRNTSANNTALSCRANAIPCGSFEQAVALQEKCGEVDLLN